jgi:outer membrane biosynthesis protein TonB
VQGIWGDLNVEFTVQADGTVAKVKAYSGHQTLQAEAERIIANSGKWKPANKNGYTIPFKQKQVISFRLL